MAGRTDARRLVLQMLYLTDLNPEADVHWVRNEMREKLVAPELVDFAWRLFTGVREHSAEIDDAIAGVAHNWRLERMAATDRAVLRMGCYELRHTDTPAAVVLDEAIELAREFGAEKSAQFVNGILDQLKRGQPSSESSGSTSENCGDLVGDAGPLA